MKLVTKTYFHPKMQLKYMGSSQFKDFQRCEAAALASVLGQYERPTTPALLLGSYVDAHFEGSLDLFVAQHPQLFKRDGSLKAEYGQAEAMIRRLEQDELFCLLMAGRKQIIKTGKIAGVLFKIKIDSYLNAAQCLHIAKRFPAAAEALGFCDGALVDLKCMKDLRPIWSAEERAYLPFVEAWGYDIQGAIYQAVEGKLLPFVLAVGTKEDTTNLGAFYIPDGDLRETLAEVERLAPRYDAIKKGLLEARPCGTCPYCRTQKKLHGILDYREAFSC